MNIKITYQQNQETKEKILPVASWVHIPYNYLDSWCNIKPEQILKIEKVA